MTFPDTKTLGIFQGGLIVRSALEIAIEDLRAKPWLLDYCFAGLLLDVDTNKQYGASEVQRAKDFFLKQRIPVFMHTHMNGIEMPCISIKLLSSAETENTLGDINYEPEEDADIQWPALVDVFDPISYDPITGFLTIPSTVYKQLYLSRGQLVVDKFNNIYPILSVKSATLIVIEAGLTVDLTGLTIKGERPAYTAAIESVEFREVYSIGVHAEGEPIKMVYLYSIVLFILLAYKQSLLEGRNFERTTVSASDEQLNEMFGKELVYSRYIQITGSCRQFWVKSILPKIVSVATQTRISDSGSLFPVTYSDQLWVGDKDPYLTVPSDKFKDEGVDDDEEI